jgi:hypothetical protein
MSDVPYCWCPTAGALLLMPVLLPDVCSNPKCKCLEGCSRQQPLCMCVRCRSGTVPVATSTVQLARMPAGTLVAAQKGSLLAASSGTALVAQQASTAGRRVDIQVHLVSMS